MYAYPSVTRSVLKENITSQTINTVQSIVNVSYFVFRVSFIYICCSQSASSTMDNMLAKSNAKSFEESQNVRLLIGRT